MNTDQKKQIDLDINERINNAKRLIGKEWMNVFSFHDYADILKSSAARRIFLKHFNLNGNAGKRMEKIQDERSKNFIRAIFAAEINETKKQKA